MFSQGMACIQISPLDSGSAMWGEQEARLRHVKHIAKFLQWQWPNSFGSSDACSILRDVVAHSAPATESHLIP